MCGIVVYERLFQGIIHVMLLRRERRRQAQRRGRSGCEALPSEALVDAFFLPATMATCVL